MTTITIHSAAVEHAISARTGNEYAHTATLDILRSALALATIPATLRGLDTSSSPDVDGLSVAVAVESSSADALWSELHSSQASYCDRTTLDEIRRAGNEIHAAFGVGWLQSEARGALPREDHRPR